ncbi:arginase family protein [Arthrobacter ginkgonis]|uniref:Arginase family protein n=1 Tax=Arthrobacter ginkgonis TaxID=1630594 RepID=A0ABP7DJ94_9MICC
MSIQKKGVRDSSSLGAGPSLRLVWPQWQGAGADVVRLLTPELPFEQARRGYAVGAAVLGAILPEHDGPTAVVPVELGPKGLEERDGVEAKDAILGQLNAALHTIEQHAPARIVTLGGECSVSVAPFANLAERYGEDLAVVWVDSHPDVGTPASAYHGYHAMALGTLTGHGDSDVLQLLPATVDPKRAALAGLHSWTEDDFPNAAEWGITAFGPNELRESSQPLLEWLAGTGCTRVALHLDVDVVDSNEAIFGLGKEPGGLTTEQVHRVIQDIDAAADIVGMTIAEFVPRQVIQLQELLRGLPLL